MIPTTAARLSKLSLEDQEKEALQFSYWQLANLQGREEFRDLLSDRKFWIKKILHNFPSENRDELLLYQLNQLQARYCSRAASKAKLRAEQTQLEESTELKIERIAARFLPGISRPKATARILELEAEAAQKKRQILQDAAKFAAEADRLFSVELDQTAYAIDLTRASFKAFRNWVRELMQLEVVNFNLIIGYDFQKYLYQHLIENSAGYQITAGQLIEFWLPDQGIPEAVAYVYVRETRYWVEINFRTPRTERVSKINLPTNLAKRMNSNEAHSIYELSYSFTQN